MPMTNDEFLAAAGARCPACGSGQIFAGRLQADADAAWSETACFECGAEWQETYQLTGYAKLVTKET